MLRFLTRIAYSDIAVRIGRLEVVQQHIPEENDPWLVREMKILKSFTRYSPYLIDSFDIFAIVF
jgi:hypothetical protein